jgi:signal transduction histidine kinase
MQARSRLRRPLIIACLGAAPVVVATLGYEAVTAARARRETAESVLRDYAKLAADQLQRNVAVTLDYEWFFPVLALLADKEPGAPWPEPRLQVRGQQDTYALSDLAVRFFWMESEGALPLISEVGPSATPAAVAEHLGAVVGAHAAREYDESWYHAAIFEAAEPTSSAVRILVYRKVAEDAEGAGFVYGFEANAAALAGFLRRSLDLYALLPEALTDGEDDAELVGLRIFDARGTTLLRAGPPAGGALAATAELGARFEGLHVEAAIPPAAAGRLVVGGLPYSRLPWIGGLLVVTVMLVGIGVTLLRREQELVALREQFVAGASHELRTPLAQIRMFAETLRLRRVRSGEEERRALEIIDRESRRLAFLVENLLQFSGGAQRPQRFAPQPTDLGRLTADVVEGFTPLAAARGCRIELRATSGAEAAVDRDMFQQVILNLLDNALKYGPHGQVVAVEVAAREATVAVSVTDEGPGVGAADRPRVWERFWRGAAAGGITGTGIGLTLVKELVELHGGQVRVESGAGGGARFVVELPAAAESP